MSQMQTAVDWTGCLLIYHDKAKQKLLFYFIFLFFLSLIKNLLIRDSYWKGTINILLQGRNSPQYVMYKAELVSSQFKSLRILFNASLLDLFILFIYFLVTKNKQAQYRCQIPDRRDQRPLWQYPRWVTLLFFVSCTQKLSFPTYCWLESSCPPEQCI